jgi:pimeloyl-ACP methyl ester carboxylesterase
MPQHTSENDTHPHPAPATGKFIDAGGLKLHYLDYGTAGRVPMLCIHGGAAHSHWFDFVAGAFTADYHVRALDLRGHGNSEWTDPPEYGYKLYAADIAEVVEKLDLRDFVLVGHSMGGIASLVYAATRPGRVARLIIVDSTMHMAVASVAGLRDMGTREGGRYPSREELVSRYRLLPSGTVAAPHVVRHVAEQSGRQHDDGTWRHKFDRNMYATFERLDAMPFWNDVRVPALLVKGDRSERITDEIFAEVKARCPQAELIEVSHSDHHVTLDNPSGFVRAVKPFLARP